MFNKKEKTMLKRLLVIGLLAVSLIALMIAEASATCSLRYGYLR
jgi:hypothetical protein